MENRRPITYTFEDIKRYRQGLMNREEMHAFEKASMEDPFLADALEGYMETDITLAEKQLNNIKERITNKEEQKEKAVVVAMPQRSFGFMRIAAMLIVVVGAGLLTYKILDKKDVAPGGQVAKTDPLEKVNPAGDHQAAAPVNSLDSGKKTNAGSTSEQNNNGTVYYNQNSTATNSVAKADDSKAYQITTTDKSRDQLANAPKMATEKETKTKPAKEPLPTLTKVVTEDVALSNTKAGTYSFEVGDQIQNNQFRGRVLTPNNQPLANANIQLDNSKRSIVTDEQGNFQLNAKDSVVTATVASSGYMNTRVQLRSNSENTINIGNIVLQSDPAVENTIAVTGLGVMRKEKIADTLSTKPEGGWESFQQYVANKLNIKLDTTGSDMRMTGQLEIEFFVDANGVPKDFKILNSTNPALNEQAIEAVKTGPKWATRKKKTRILIRY